MTQDIFESNSQNSSFMENDSYSNEQHQSNDSSSQNQNNQFHNNKNEEKSIIIQPKIEFKEETGIIYKKVKCNQNYQSIKVDKLQKNVKLEYQDKVILKNNSNHQNQNCQQFDQEKDSNEITPSKPIRKKRKSTVYQKYTSTPIKNKEEIVQLHVKYGISTTDLSNQYNVPVINIQNWIKTYKKAGKLQPSSKGGRKPLYLNLENELMQICLNYVYENGKKMPRQLIIEKALQLNDQNDFQASKGWFDKFKKRQNYEQVINNALQEYSYQQQQLDNDSEYQQQNEIKIVNKNNNTMQQNVKNQNSQQQSLEQQHQQQQQIIQDQLHQKLEQNQQYKQQDLNLQNYIKKEGEQFINDNEQNQDQKSIKYDENTYNQQQYIINQCKQENLNLLQDNEQPIEYLYQNQYNYTQDYLQNQEQIKQEHTNLSDKQKQFTQQHIREQQNSLEKQIYNKQNMEDYIVSQYIIPQSCLEEKNNDQMSEEDLFDEKLQTNNIEKILNFDSDLNIYHEN